MQVAHFVVVTPKRCGLYETTRELVAALNVRGVDARMVDPTQKDNRFYPHGQADDRGAPLANLEWAKTADLVVSHSGTGDVTTGWTQPVIHVAHGRPRSSFLLEQKGSTPIYSYHYAKNTDPQTVAVVTFWPEHEPYLRVMFPNKPVFVVPAPVDLDAWTPTGPRGYAFHKTKGVVNVVCADAWRDDVDPFIAVNAYALWARERKGVKLHLYGAHPDRKGWGALLKRLGDDGTLGEVCRWVDGLANVYRAADCAITSNSIDTRSVREAMACGCPVVRLANPRLNGYPMAFDAALNQSRDRVRRMAEMSFHPSRCAESFAQLLEPVRAMS